MKLLINSCPVRCRVVAYSLIENVRIVSNKDYSLTTFYFDLHFSNIPVTYK